MKKRIGSFLLAVVMSLSLIVSAAAAETSFPDVSPTKDAWCYTQVIKAAEAGLMNGYGNGLFGKNDPITRGQMVQILYNYYGEDCGTNSGFSDVSADAWYAKAVTWASKNGVVSGYSNGTFGPNNHLTREQMVTILYNVAGRPSVDSTVLAQFKDRGQVAAYAVDGFAWAVSNNVVSGTSSTTLSPRGTATRAQVAVILIRYLENVEDVKFPDVSIPTQPAATGSKNADGTTNADYVNSLSDVGKRSDYPTKGDASTANANGFNTKANVDISGAKLRYDAIPYVNEFLAKHPNLKGTLSLPWDTTMRWATTDEQEEYTLLRAKEAYSYFEHKRPDGTSILSAENLYMGPDVASGVIYAWEHSSGHASTMLAAGYETRETCIASYKGVWVMTIESDEGRTAFLLPHAPMNYFW